MFGNMASKVQIKHKLDKLIIKKQNKNILVLCRKYTISNVT